MADQSNGDSGSKDRATVALVLGEVKVVAKSVEGLENLTRAEFSEVHRRLEDVKGLPVLVADLTARVRALETAPARLISAAGLLVAVAAVAVAFIH